MVAKHYGKSFTSERLRQLTATTREGASLLGIAEAAELMGFRTLAVKVSVEKLLEDAPMPCILHWNQNHFVVLYATDSTNFHGFQSFFKGKEWLRTKQHFHISDPAHGLVTLTQTEFISQWIGNNATDKTEEGIALLLEPTEQFHNQENEHEKKDYGFARIGSYVWLHKKLLWQLCFGLLAASTIQLALPFFTQSMVDTGVRQNDLQFVYLVLFAQLALFIGRSLIEVIQTWIFLHIGMRVNISLVSDFFIKLMRLPISFFDVKVTGDILQRIHDNQRVEQLLTSGTIQAIFSVFTLVVFGGILALYDWRIFTVFSLGTGLYAIWVSIFLKKRKDYDYKQFSRASDEQTKIIELINGMQEIKLHNAEQQKRWGWERLRIALFKTHLKSLTLEQFQSTGANFINEFKNIFITFLAAKLVIDGKITLGMMLSISYITGQLNSPVQALMSFVLSLQTAKISLERLAEIHTKDDEESIQDEKLQEFETNQNIVLDNISFAYPGSKEEVIKELSMTIPAYKTTAIVGASGSGKTTLLKLLLRFYEPKSGLISLGATPLANLAHRAWRNVCGTVMQDGFIFNDSIAHNIAVGDEQPNAARVRNAARIACIQDFIEELPLLYNTKIGQDGNGISGGQRQRILIARAVYKNPSIVFFDEATSSLDANNEKQIMQNLDEFLKGKTAVVIAHRLSTVKNADKIVVLDKGKIIEEGTHETLTAKRGAYYELVKNQLELGN
jgi:ATP-binding cassette subfamily B protein